MAGYPHLHHPSKFVRCAVVISVNRLRRLTALSTMIRRKVIVTKNWFVLGDLRPVIAATIAKKIVAAAVGDVNALI